MSWIETTLGDSCEMYQPQTITTKELKHDGKYLVYGANGVIGRYDKYNHEEPQLLVTCRGATCGSVNISSPFSWINGNAMVVKPKRKDINIKFLEYFFRGAVDLTKAITGAAQPQITRQSLSPVRFGYPTLDIQNEIVLKLDNIFAEIDKAIAASKANIKNAESFFQSYLNDIFENAGESWNSIQISKLGRVQSGGTPSISKKEYWGGDIEWYSSGELNDLYTLPALRMVTTEGIKNSNAKVFPRNSLLVGMYDTAAMKMSLLSEPAAFNQAIVGIEPNENVNMTYLYYALSYIKPYVLSLRRGVRQKNLSLAKIKELDIKFPSLEIQNTYAKKLNYINETATSLKTCYINKVNEYELLRKSILQKSFNNELIKE